MRDFSSEYCFSSGERGRSAQLLRYATIALIYSGIKLRIVQVGVVDITAMPEFTSGNFSCEE